MTPAFTILVVDDEAPQRELLAGFLTDEGYEVVTAPSGPKAMELLEDHRVDLALLDYRMPEMDGLTLLQRLKARLPELPVVMVTAYGSVGSAVEAMKLGAHDYIGKPLDLDALLHLVARVQERQALLHEIRDLKERLAERVRFEHIVGESGKMQEVLSLVARVAPTPSTVLVRGENGTGKELIASAIHHHSPRAGKAFVRVNIAALPETLLESELFGHEKGAFTGAAEARVGRFEAADGGTLFLDEIGDLAPGLQVKLLRVLQEREVERLGSNRPRKVDVRIIAATSRHLEAMIADGTFREDLYYRLSVIPIVLPPLRERREDIPYLVEHLIQKFAPRAGKAVEGVSPEALACLLAYGYPGNIRELENILERAVVLARHNLVLPEDLPDHVRRGHGTGGTRESALPQSLPDLVDEVERQAIVRALERHDGVQVKAADELGINERVLRYKMKKLGIARS